MTQTHPLRHLAPSVLVFAIAAAACTVATTTTGGPSSSSSGNPASSSSGGQHPAASCADVCNRMAACGASMGCDSACAQMSESLKECIVTTLNCTALQACQTSSAQPDGGGSGADSGRSSSTPTPCDPPQVRAAGTQCAARTADSSRACVAAIVTGSTVVCTHDCGPGDTCGPGYSCDRDVGLCVKTCDSDATCKAIDPALSCGTGHDATTGMTVGFCQ